MTLKAWTLAQLERGYRQPEVLIGYYPDMAAGHQYAATGVYRAKGNQVAVMEVGVTASTQAKALKLLLDQEGK